MGMGANPEVRSGPSPFWFGMFLPSDRGRWTANVSRETLLVFFVATNGLFALIRLGFARQTGARNHPVKPNHVRCPPATVWRTFHVSRETWGLSTGVTGSASQVQSSPLIGTKWRTLASLFWLEV